MGTVPGWKLDDIGDPLAEGGLNTVDGSGGDYSVGGEHLAGDTCVVDARDFTAPCEG